MPKISFEVTDQEYQTLAALAALKNLSIEAYLVECISNDMADKEREHKAGESAIKLHFLQRNQRFNWRLLS